MTPQILAMLLFAFGGIGGLVNASYIVNLAIHDSAWIVGHFHLTVGSAVTLTFMSVSYWLLPRLLGRKLWSPKLAMTQAWLWFVGMIIFSNALHRLGLLDMPRRTAIGEATYVQQVGGSGRRRVAGDPAAGGDRRHILAISGVIYIVVCVMTALIGKRVWRPSRSWSSARHRPGPSTRPRCSTAGTSGSSSRVTLVVVSVRADAPRPADDQWTEHTGTARLVGQRAVARDVCKSVGRVASPERRLAEAQPVAHRGEAHMRPSFQGVLVVVAIAAAVVLTNRIPLSSLAPQRRRAWRRLRARTGGPVVRLPAMRALARHSSRRKDASRVTRRKGSPAQSGPLARI